MQRVFLSAASTDRERAARLSSILSGHGVDCIGLDYKGDGPDNRPEELARADAVVVVLTSATTGSTRVRRDLEHLDDMDVPVYPVRLDDVEPVGFLSYFLGTHQWVDAFGEGADERIRLLAEALSSGRGMEFPPGARRSRWRRSLLPGLMALMLTAALTMALSGRAPSGDCLLVGSNPRLEEYISSLGYDVHSAHSLPGIDELQRFDFVVLGASTTDGSDALLLEDYLGGGGGLLLMSGHPYYLGMPPWMGMEVYDNHWGTDFPLVAACDRPAGSEGVAAGDTMVYVGNYMDGGAVLTGRVTADVDLVYPGEPGRAAAIRNVTGEGRLAWMTGYPCPTQDGDVHTTDEHGTYLEALYAWLDGDGAGI